jgi:hypothetical protein
MMKVILIAGAAPEDVRAFLSAPPRAKDASGRAR